MKLVLLTALGVGGATIFGSILGFIFKKISHKERMGSTLCGIKISVRLFVVRATE